MVTDVVAKRPGRKEKHEDDTIVRCRGCGYVLAKLRLENGSYAVFSCPVRACGTVSRFDGPGCTTADHAAMLDLLDQKPRS